MKTLSKILLVFAVFLFLGVSILVAYQWYQNRQIDISDTIEEVIVEEDLNTSTWQDVADENYVIDSEGFVKEFSQVNDLHDDEKDLAETARLEQISKNFIEVFGSYSTDNDYQNLKDLKPLVTESYWVELENYIVSGETQSVYSVWTTALKAELINKSSSEALIKVKTKKGERTSRTETEHILYQNADIYLLKENGVWLVSKVKWIK